MCVRARDTITVPKKNSPRFGGYLALLLRSFFLSLCESKFEPIREGAPQLLHLNELNCPAIVV